MIKVKEVIIAKEVKMSDAGDVSPVAMSMFYWPLPLVTNLETNMSPNMVKKLKLVTDFGELHGDIFGIHKTLWQICHEIWWQNGRTQSFVINLLPNLVNTKFITKIVVEYGDKNFHKNIVMNFERLLSTCNGGSTCNFFWEYLERENIYKNIVKILIRKFWKYLYQYR